MGTMQERLRSSSGSSSRSSGKASIELVGSDILTARLLSIPQDIRKAVEKQALKEGTKLVAGTLRQNVPIDTRTLHRGIKDDIRTHKGGNLLIGRVGADYDYVKTVKGKTRRPAKYIHLVDLGTQERKTRDDKKRGSVTGLHFREKVMDQLKDQLERLFENAVADALK